jgi:CheY-like chemotaxis protein
MKREQDEKVILLVEDDSDHEALTLRALKKHNVVNKIVVARDGAEALDYLFRDDLAVLPQLVLLDLKLPKMSGHEVLRRIREHPRTRMLPVVVLTSSDEESDLIASYRMGVNSYIRKPVNFADFTEAARQVGIYWLVLNQCPPMRP